MHQQINLSVPTASSHCTPLSPHSTPGRHQSNWQVATHVFPKAQMRKIFLNLYVLPKLTQNIVLSESCMYEHFLFEAGLSRKPCRREMVKQLLVYTLISQTFLIIVLLLFFFLSWMSFLHSLVYNQISTSIKRTGGTQRNWSDINVCFFC